MDARWARVETDWSIYGLTALVLANDRLRVIVLPELGGRIWEVLDLASGHQLLWHNQRLRPGRVRFGAGYDDNFLGGWDELFPNDLAENLAGEPFPDHGETWSEPWAWEVLPGPDAAVRLSLTTRISASRLQRTVRLGPGQARVSVEVEATNGLDVPLPMLHKQHLAVDLPPGARIDLPASRIEIGDFGRPRAGASGDEFDWPWLPTPDGPVDFAATPADDGAVSEFLFATRLEAGWCACTRPDGVGVTLSFDPAVYPSCWTFASWGGWRRHRVAVLEPCTGVGPSVLAGVADGRHRVLAPGETVATRLDLILHRDLAEVTGVTRTGGEPRVEGVPR
ncbi:MAG: hypothetical protein J0I14_12680 [Propionibacteriaceae bacterium]|jgi:hypothetical protein|nr:hypothetical protein [Propionibacteriaceae bacterium]